MMDDLLQIIEEQADVIMRQSERILKLATLLLEKCEVTQAELDSIIENERHGEEWCGWKI